MKTLALISAGILSAAAIYWLAIGGRDAAPPYRETVQASKDLLPALRLGATAETSSSIRIEGQTIPGSSGLAGVLRRGLEIQARGPAGDRVRMLRVSLSSGESWGSFRYGQIGSRSLLGIADRWYPLDDRRLTEAIVPGGSPSSFLRVWKALPEDAEPVRSWQEDGLDHYRLRFGPEAARTLARVWSGDQALIQLAPSLGSDVELAFDQQSQALVEVSASGRISSNRLSELLGLRSSAPFGGLRSIDLRLSYGATRWGQARIPEAGQMGGTAREGQAALAQQLLPLWAGIASS
jgi:hypothetical protein